MNVVSSNALRTFVIAIVCAVAVQTTAIGAVWVDPNGNTVGPALDNQAILLQIPGGGKIVVVVGLAIYPMTLGDPIRYQYSFVHTSAIPSPNPVMSFASSDCTGQGYTHAFQPITGNTVQASQFFDSVNDWLVVGSYPTITPVPHFNSQLVHGTGSAPLDGPGAYCQTVDVTQGGPVVPVTQMINQSTLASPAMTLQ